MNKNEKGSTLIITLLTIVVILIFSTVLINTTLNSATQINRSEEDIQVTNLAEMGIVHFHESFTAAIADLKSKGLPISVANVADAMSFIDTGEVEVVDNEYSYILEVGEPYFDPDKNQIAVPYQSIGIIYRGTEPSVERTLTDIMTIAGDIVRPSEEDDEPDESEPTDSSNGKAFKTKDEFSKLSDLRVPPVVIPPGSLNFSKDVEQSGSETYSNSVNFNKNLKLNTNASQSVRDHFYIKQDIELVSPSSLSIGGNAQFDGKADIKSNSKVEVGGSLLIKNELLLDTSSSLKIGGAAELNNKLDVKSNSTLSVSDFLLVKGDAIFDASSKISVGTDANFENKLDIKEGGTFRVGNNLYIKGATLLDTSSFMKVGGSLRLDNKLEVKEQAYLLVDQHLFLKGETELDTNATIKVKGNASFEKPIENQNGKVCIYGSATFAHNQDKAGIIDYATSCDNQPNGTIYVLNRAIDAPNNGTSPGNGDDPTDGNNGEIEIGSEGVQY